MAHLLELERRQSPEGLGCRRKCSRLPLVYPPLRDHHLPVEDCRLPRKVVARDEAQVALGVRELRRRPVSEVADNLIPGVCAMSLLAREISICRDSQRS